MLNNMAKKKKSGKNVFVDAYRKVTGWKWFWVVGNLSLAVIIALALIFGAQGLLSLGTDHGEHLAVPEFVGMTYKDAQAAAEKAGVRLTIVDSVYAKKGRGLVREQNPSPGSKVKENRRILITMNAHGVQKVAVPNLVGYSLRQAQSELASSQLKVGKLIYVPDLATNNVLEQLYKGRPIEPGREIPSESIIDLKVGLNAADSVAIIPDLLGKPYAIIKDYLIDNSLNLGEVFFDNPVTNLHDSLAAFAYRQELKLPENDSIPRYGTAVSVYFTLDKSLIPVKETEETDEAEEER